VRVFLPASASGAPALKAPSVPMLSGSGLVLVIDDETEVRATARAMLEALGYDVIEAEDGGSGLMQFDRHRETIAAVLLDMTMPVMSGEQVYLEMRRRSSTVPVVLSTGFSRVEVRRSGAVDGLDGFLQKPYTVRQLGEVIGRCIAERRKQA
jgi:FixJ family two-component response regulator